MDAKCPGRDGRLLTVEDITCPKCGTSVEFFSDEQKRKCPGCGERVTREAVPACAAWCTAAASCLGQERFDAAVKSGLLGGSGGGGGAD
jgi:endogenous inhibitor of DNA gyrase (YacG/DUF329 family)